MDVGGTSLKTCVVEKTGAIIDSSFSVAPIDSAGSAESILKDFALSLEGGFEFIQKKNLNLHGIGISIGGPFDWEKGISKIRGLDKYESLYNVNIKKHLQELLRLPDSLPFLFDVDAWSFARGEVWLGGGRYYSRVMVFTLGTGVGSAFAVDGDIVSDSPGVPWLGWVAGQKYKDGLLHDYISRTYMMAQYRSMAGETVEIDELAQRAQLGDKKALFVFNGVGRELGEFLKTHNIKEFRPECILFGGQISRSYQLFIEPIRAALSEFSFLKVIEPASDLEQSALKGVAKFVFDNTPG